MNAKKVNLRKMINTVLDEFSIECTNKMAIANNVLDQETGKMMEYHHLITHKNHNVRTIQNTSVSNDLGCLFQGVDNGDDRGKRIK